MDCFDKCCDVFPTLPLLFALCFVCGSNDTVDDEKAANMVCRLDFDVCSFLLKSVVFIDVLFWRKILDRISCCQIVG